jgi:ankyrin repeat protein
MTRPHDIALSMTQLLIMYGADLEGPVNSDITPLTAAVKRKYENFVELMLRENVNPNVLDKKGNSPLIWAIKSNSSAIVSMLIKKNAMEKYIYYENEKKKTMNACEVAQSMKKLSLTPTDKKSNEEILNLLGCGLRWLL